MKARILEAPGFALGGVLRTSPPGLWRCQRCLRSRSFSPVGAARLSTTFAHDVLHTVDRFELSA